MKKYLNFDRVIIEQTDAPEPAIPFEGDYFGDYLPEEFDDQAAAVPDGGDGVQDGDEAERGEDAEGMRVEEDDGREEEDEEGEDDDDDSNLPGWEPPPVNLPDLPIPMDEDVDVHVLDRDARQRVESQASGKTTVVRFPGTEAGKVHASHGEGIDSSHWAYAASVGITAGAPYAPFKSKLDWEVARWAKLRGPGATALTDLLKIENVSSKNTVFTHCRWCTHECRYPTVGGASWAVLQDVATA